MCHSRWHQCLNPDLGNPDNGQGHSESTTSGIVSTLMCTKSYIITWRAVIKASDLLTMVEEKYIPLWPNIQQGAELFPVSTYLRPTKFFFPQIAFSS